MELIATSIRIPVAHDKVLEAITTTAGHRGWWVNDCDVGRAVGEEAVYRFGTVEVAFRIDRIDARGIEMTCVRNKNFPDWQGTHLSLRAVADGSGTYVDLLHDGYPARNGVYDKCASEWGRYAQSLKSYGETGRGAPYRSQEMK